MAKKKKITIDDLARITQEGFLGLGEKFDKRMDSLEKRIGNLKDGQEEIKLRLDNVAYRFELVELQKRVDLLEKIILPKIKKRDLVSN